MLLRVACNQPGSLSRLRRQRSGTGSSMFSGCGVVSTIHCSHSAPSRPRSLLQARRVPPTSRSLAKLLPSECALLGSRWQLWQLWHSPLRGPPPLTRSAHISFLVTPCTCSNRKSKLIFLYELVVDLKWKGESEWARATASAQARQESHLS